MKIRRRTASLGICISMSFHRVECAAQQVTEPYGNHAEDDREQNVAACVKPFAIAKEIQGLKTERGKGRVTATNAGDQELGGEHAGLRGHFSFRGGQGAEN